MKKAYLIYRENDLFETVIPMYKEALNSNGIEFSEKSFSRETEKGEIEKWFFQNEKEILKEGTIVLTDKTCGYDSIYHHNQKVCNQHHFYASSLIDEITDQASLNSMNLGSLKLRDVSGPLREENTFTAIIETIFKAAGKANPERIVIDASNLSDHHYFDWLTSKVNRRNQEEVSQMLEKGGITTEENLSYGGIPSIAIAIGMKEALIEKGLPEEKIVLCFKKDSKVDLEEVKKAKHFYIKDRHYRETLSENSILLQLPLANLVKDCNELNLLDFDSEVLKEEIKKLLEEHFIKPA